MKVLVTYYSETGNTEKVAQAIYKGAEGVDRKILPIKEVSDASGYDMIFIGFPVHAHSVPPKVAEFVKGFPEGQKLAYFATHGSLKGGELAITAFYHALSLAKQMKVLGTFGCRGKVKDELLEALMKKPEHRAWAEEAQSAIGHPGPAELEDAADWAHEMITKARSRM